MQNRTKAIILKLTDVKSTENLKKNLFRKKIYIRNNFGKPIENYVRVSLGSPKKLSVFFKEYLKWKKRLANNLN